MNAHSSSSVSEPRRTPTTVPPRPHPADGGRNDGTGERRPDPKSLGTGEPMDRALRSRMEAGLGHHFGQVRIHADSRAAEMVSGLGARAATSGAHVAFGAGLYRPGTQQGDRLIAHELAHVVQQGGQESTQGGGRQHDRRALTTAVDGAAPLERQADRAAAAVGTAERPPGDLARAPGAATVQLDDGKGESGAGAAPAGAKDRAPDPLTLTFVFRAPDDEFTREVTAYTENTLGDKNVIQVDNFDDIFTHLERLRASGSKVGRIRLIGHGSTTGGIKMTPAGEQSRRFVSAEEIEQVAGNKNLRDTAAAVMTRDAVVEFWGCNVGGTQKTGTAVSTLFNSEFRATDETLHTLHDEYARRPEKGEKGPVRITSSAQIDSRAAKNPQLKAHFERWLLARYARAVADGDIPPRASRPEQIAAMREVFDRSQGRIRRLVISPTGEAADAVTRGDRRWLRKWKTTKVNP